MKNYMKYYRKKYPIKNKNWIKTGNKSRRIRALIKINPNLSCYCGRKDLSIIEIHHTKRNGKIDRINLNGAKFYNAIISGLRKVDDLELKCKICNLLDYINQLQEEYPINK